ncbi:MAG: DMT family transporter [Proteobacteria bacterium]|nr:DMT family transporter [Pseudomonadota bacterium]MDA1296149.1 DMT family transporter [Pseudomonadota bacterium]
MGAFLSSPRSGYLACTMVVCIWAFWLIVSRIGATSTLTIYDLAALRYGISAVVALPFVIFFKAWKNLPLQRIVILTFLLGPLYILTVFSGFIFAPAAHGGVFMNGPVPIMTLILGAILLNTAIEYRKLAGAALIIVSSAVLGFGASGLMLAQSWIGDLCFVFGGLCFAVFVTLSRLWNIKTLDIFFCGSVVNAVIYVPVWYFFLPSGFATTEISLVILQSIYQGLLPNLVGLVFIAHASKTAGADVTAAFMAIVPGFGALLGVILLSEQMPLASWGAIVGLTAGLLLMARKLPQSRDLKTGM